MVCETKTTGKTTQPGHENILCFGYNQDIKFSTEFNVWTSNKRKEITRERREEKGKL